MNYNNYNFENPFTIYSGVKDPEKREILLDMPLSNKPLNISNWADGVTDQGIPIVKDNSPKFIINNNPEMNVTDNISIKRSTPTIQTNKSVSNNVSTAKKFFADKLYQYHKERGLEDNDALKLASIQSAGIVGNLMLESGDNTLTKTDNIGDKNLGPDKSAYGMGQWRLDRRTALKNFAAKRGKPMSDFMTQLEFTWDEINGSQKGFKVLEKLTNSTTVEEATENFMNSYERPNKDPKINGLNRRIGYARSLV